MKKKIAVLALTGVFAAGSAFASGYRIPEQSVNSTALSAAYTANAHGADAAYFNPANMSWEKDKTSWLVEADLMYINLPSVDFTGTNAATNGSSNSADFLIPHFHMVSPAYGDFRVGLSLTAPGGLSTRRDGQFQRASAEEFTLSVLELNPTISWKASDKFSWAAGLRLIYADGKVSSYANGTALAASLFARTGSTTIGGTGSTWDTLSRDLTGDTTEFGYNLAVSIKPTEEWTVAATWRSKVDLDVEGDATLYSTATSGGAGIPAAVAAAYNQTYSGSGSVSIPLPEVLSIATSYTINDRTTLEVSWDRTFWSAYDQLDFNYNQTFTGGSGIPNLPHALNNFDAPKEKNWRDTDAIRFGITQKVNEALTVMVGFALDESPVPNSTMGYELPSGYGKIYSLGGRYAFTDALELGLAYLYTDKADNAVSNSDVSGTFSNMSAHIFAIGLSSKF